MVITCRMVIAWPSDGYHTGAHVITTWRSCHNRATCHHRSGIIAPRVITGADRDDELTPPLGEQGEASAVGDKEPSAEPEEAEARWGAWVDARVRGDYLDLASGEEVSSMYF